VAKMNFRQFKKDIGEETLIVYGCFLIAMFFVSLIVWGVYLYAFP
jgi:hypothetical protein